MAYPVRELISRAWYLSGIVSRKFQTVSGEQSDDGLYLLNALLDIKSALQRLIPYYKEYQFDAVVGQQEYFVPNLIMLESATFNNGVVRYPMQPQSRKDYFGSARADDITSLPFSYHVERCKDGSNMFMYFLPDQTYPIKVWGKFSLEEVGLDDDLEDTFDKYYIEYLRYALANYLCQEYGYSFSPEKKMELKKIESGIFDISPIDMTLTKISSLSKSVGINYGIVNLSNGWIP